MPEDPAGIQRIFTNDLLRIIFSLAVGILFFFLATILGKMIFPYKFYSSLQYLLLSLLASAAICWCVSSLLKKAAAKGQKH